MHTGTCHRRFSPAPTSSGSWHRQARQAPCSGHHVAGAIFPDDPGISKAAGRSWIYQHSI